MQYDWGITLTAENVTPSGLTLVSEQSGGENIAQLETGEYRIGKEFMSFRGTGDFDKQVIYAEFSIKE